MRKQNIIDYDKEIGPDLYYDSLMCLGGYFKVSSLQELTAIEDIDNARKLCKQCVYSKL